MSLVTTRTDEPISFRVHDVETTEDLLPVVDSRHAIEELAGGKIEASSLLGKELCGNIATNPFITAAALAHAQHRPLVFTPDTVWLAILQGLSVHLEINWRSFGSLVTSSDIDRRYVAVSTDEFPTGSPESPWGDFIVEAASIAYGAVNEEFADLFNLSFSTSTVCDQAAKDVAFLSGGQLVHSAIRLSCGLWRSRNNDRWDARRLEQDQKRYCATGQVWVVLVD